jgi:hypothetical protein
VCARLCLVNLLCVVCSSIRPQLVDGRIDGSSPVVSWFISLQSRSLVVVCVCVCVSWFISLQSRSLVVVCVCVCVLVH